MAEKEEKNGKRMEKYDLLKRLFFCVVLSVGLSGCGAAEDRALGNTDSMGQGQTEAFAELSTEQSEMYQQMTLYLQEGFRTHGVDGEYQAYFGQAECGGSNPDKCICNILLEGEGKLWGEIISCTYDEETGWYTFNGQDEPVLCGDDTYALYEDSDFAAELRENPVYRCLISAGTDLAYPVRYTSEGGPIEHEKLIEMPYSDAMAGLSYGVWPMLYTYQDDRLDTYITISYPQVFMGNEHKDTEAAVNSLIKEAFFYGYNEDSFNPRAAMYVDIDRSFIITRRDEEYLSMRIYEYNDYRGAVHPNEWETGITIDMRTGEALKLSDITGKDCSILSLLDSGAFECIWLWENDDGWIDEFRENTEQREASLSDFDSYFYLTEKGLGLITSMGRYYTNIEADFEELGLGE